MAQNDTHVALIILTTQMWGGKLLVEKTFSGQILCSCAFGANIHSYTKQRARHGTPFLQPPPLLRRAFMSPPPPPPQSNFQVAQTYLTIELDIELDIDFDETEIHTEIYT